MDDGSCGRKRPRGDPLLVGDAESQKRLQLPTRTRQKRAKTSFFASTVFAPYPRSRQGRTIPKKTTTRPRPKAATQFNKSPAKPVYGNFTGFHGDVQLGRYRFAAEYSSPYGLLDDPNPACLFICEYCLAHQESDAAWRTHKVLCTTKNPEGRELYREDGTKNGRSEMRVVYEVDGAAQTSYCLRLGLLGKLFLSVSDPVDTRCLLYYVLCIKGSTGDHPVGYFTRRKMTSRATSSLSTVVVFPPFQKRGYGGFLISFSYLLCRCEGSAGTPDLPTSQAGAAALEACKRRAVSEYLQFHCSTRDKKAVDFREASAKTGVSAGDVTRILFSTDGCVYDALSQSFVVKCTAEDLERRSLLQSIKRAAPIDISALNALPFRQIKKNEKMK